MSFGSGGFGGFGQQNNNQQPNTGFGTFGQSNPSGGFGSSTTGFGANTTPNTGGSGALFGSSNTSATGTGFGGFGGANNSSPFGQKPGGFGAPATTSGGGGLFGGNTATSGTAGFGFGGNTASTTPAFGASTNTGGGLFGQSKPAFGSGTTTGGMFGGGGGSPGFGGTNTTTTGFGASPTAAFGAASAAPNQGTAVVPFTPHSEKEGTGAAATNSQYQSITFMQPYKDYSFEELRFADYNQGRRFGNANGQAGAFGTSTGFGGFGGATTTTSGFGSSAGGMFGSNTNTSSPFGQQATTNTGFGSTTTGSLFGAKPAGTTGLFGGTPATSGQQSGGLFGTSGSGGGFGTGTTGGFGASATGGGLFGQQNQTQPQNQQKPAFGFGTTNTGGLGSGTPGFGQTNATSSGGGLFGGSAPATTSTFGGMQQTNATNPFGGFGQQNQQNQTQSGGLFGGGFGSNNNQQKPGGLFGGAAPSTGAGLFGQQPNNQQQQSGGLFGGASNQQTGGVFGQKPATTGTSLFGSNNAAPAAGGTSGGLFGGLGNQSQQNQGTSLFGQSNNQQQSGGLFAKPATTSTSLFGGTNAAPAAGTGGLFGSLNASTQQSQQQPQLGSSLFGGSQQMQQPQQQSLLQTSLVANPYGNEGLFRDLPAPSQSVGPVATPLSGTPKARKPAPLPQHRINPLAASRLITPLKRSRSPGEYGFSYSTYGTPGSANISPIGLGGSLLGSGSFGRSLGKSFSTSSLRTSFSAEDSILAPGAFASTGSRSHANSMRKLNIDRSLETRRPLLFGDNSSNDAPVRKQVTFDTSNASNNDASNGATSSQNGLGPSNGALVRTERHSPSPPAREQDRSRSQGAADAPQTNGAPARSEMQQVNGNELAVVHEDGSPEPAASQKSERPRDPAREKAKMMQTDQELGEYWSQPSIEEIKKMTPEQKKSVELVVGRDGSGKIEFSSVDLTGIDPDAILDDIVKLGMRNVAVYGEGCSVNKPPQGKGLNLPSVITLENSWPRSSGGRLAVLEKKGPRFEKHIQRLKRVGGTEFVDYDLKSGSWTFKVQHYTTYGMDYEGEPARDDSRFESGMGTPTPKSRTSHSGNGDMSMSSPSGSSPDDTFEFKKGKRKTVPGSFDDEMVDEDDDVADGQDDTMDTTKQSFLDERSVGSPVEDGHEDQDAIPEESESESVDDEETASSFSRPTHTTEQDVAQEPPPTFTNSVKPKSILKASRSAVGTPAKAQFSMGTDWTEQLQRTVSPRKQNRQVLRESQATVLKERQDHADNTPKAVTNGRAFATSIDLMNSLFDQNTTHSARRKGFEWPYPKRSKTGDDIGSMSDSDKAFHQSHKPSWGPNDILVYAIPGDTPKMRDGTVVNLKGSVVSEHRDIRFAKFAPPADLVPDTLSEQKSVTKIRADDAGIPYAVTTDEFDFAQFAELVDISTPAGAHEQRVWQLASILFDDIGNELPDEVPREQYREFEWRLRKDKLSDFWKNLVQPDADEKAYAAKSCEEKAVQYLSGGNVVDACGELVKGMDFRLATMVSQIGGDEVMRAEMSKQIEDWKRLNVLSEVGDPIRAMYELMAGSTSVCEGKTGAGPENKLSTFHISSRFGLDWRRAFGLRLWYGTYSDEALEAAVQQFLDDLESGSEQAKPVPWFVEQGADTGWTDPTPTAREDPLWGLLKLYTAQQRGSTAASPSILAPENTAGNPLHARLSFQLVHLLRARAALTPPDARPETAAAAAAQREAAAAADALSATYAASLLAGAADDAWLSALWALTHLSRPEARRHALREVLATHAHLIPREPDADDESGAGGGGGFATLTRALRIPPAWLFAAQAQHARAVLGDRAREARCLLAAREWEAAHEVLARVVAPRAVVQRAPEDVEALRELLAVFGRRDEARGVDVAPREGVAAWATGGAVYADFLALGEALGRERGEVLRRLGRALEALAAEVGGRELEERVAVWEMGRVVAEALAREEAADKARVLRLPLTEDACLKHTRELSLGYYRAVLADGF